ncbi:MAG: glycosyltransferase [Castellaniella sp.]|uniref:glycosyltransferase n=1 Tax=Castellaniella sp. TaxID=1955812 RepID=UPI002A363561|nr:glycosyltransferase [Castellaniella sp.]MDY0309743.1 glycosyltransferase [Castellaniella sp.]
MARRGSMGALARNAGALYGVQLASYLVPLLEIPILARALGPALYGQILFCQGLALTASVVAEYGFNLNAAQQAAVRGDRATLAGLFAQVMGAKTLLAVPMIAIGLLVWMGGWDGVALADPALVPFVIAYFLAFGYSPMWYFQGVERMAGPAALDVALRLGGLAVLAWAVRGPGDFHVALWILALPPLLNTGLTLGWARWQLGPGRWDWRGSWRQLREGFHFFVYRGAGSLSMAAVPVGLGMAAGQHAVGVFGPAEKLLKGMVSLAQPVLMALYPVCARTVGRGGRAAFGGAARLVLMLGLLAWVGTLVGLWLGPWVLGLMLGDGFQETQVVFGWLLGLAPVRVLNQGLALLLLIPAGRARAASYVISGFSLVAVLVGVMLSRFYGGPGMAAGLLVGEGLLCGALLCMAWRLGRARRSRDVGVAAQGRLRILLVSTGLNMGGAERQVVDLADSLAAQGHRVMIAYMVDGVALRPKHRRVSLYPLHCAKTPRGLLRGYARLAAMIYRWQPDVVHSHMVHANLLARLARLAAPMRRLVCTAHSNREGGRAVVLAYRVTDALADVTTHVSHEAAAEYEQAGAVPAGGMVTVYNGIDVRRFQDAQDDPGDRIWPGVPGRRRVLAVGRLVPEKNQAALLRAFALVADDHADTDLWIAGDGPLRADLATLLTELGLAGRAFLMGERHDVPELMRAADLLVLSSRVEGFGLVVAEAMASGTLVVATDVGGVAEVMGNQGFLVPPDDVAALAQGISDALRMEPSRALLLAACNRAYVVGPEVSISH